MSLNYVFTWLITFYCLLVVGNIVRTGSVKESPGWLSVNIFILIVTWGGQMLFPDFNGFIAGAIWLLLVLVPSLGVSHVNRLLLVKNYAKARDLVRILWVLHPFDGWREWPELIEALEAARNGDLKRAEEIALRYDRTVSSLGRVAITNLYFLSQEWDKLVAFFDHIPEKTLLRDPSSAMYLRALGETGRLSDMIELYGRLERYLRLVDRLSLARLYLFALCGRKEEVQRLFAGGPLSGVPEATQKYWLGTAEAALGNCESAEALFEGCCEQGDFLDRKSLEWRRSHPPQSAHELLDDRAMAALDRISVQMEQESRYEHRPMLGDSKAYATWAILAVNVAVFIAESFLGGTKKLITLYDMGALVPLSVIRGEWWRIVTAQFLHYGGVHLMMNLLGLLILGPFVEHALGRWRYLLAYLVAGCGGMITFMLLALHSPADSHSVLVGASGGIMGLVGCTGAILLRGWRREGAAVASRRLIQIVFIVVLQTLFDLMTPGVSMTCHLAGALFGFMATSLMSHRISRTTSDQKS
jgi:rhomboid protease GluP